MLDEPDPLEPVGPTTIRWRGREWVYFGGCDYFRLSHHPAVLDAARSAVRPGELNVAASRRTTGNRAVYRDLEGALAGFLGVPDVVLTSSGYAANLAVAGGVGGRFDCILLDAAAHGSLMDAARLTGLPVIPFAHRDPASLEEALAGVGRGQRVVLMTDGMSARDGGVPPLRHYRRLLPREAWIWVDDAHGVGSLGAQGGGTIELEGVGRSRCIQTGTLSKAFGVYGGFVVAPVQVLRAIRERSRLYVGNTPLPPPLAAAARVAVELLGAHPEWRVRLELLGDRIRGALAARGIREPANGGEGLARVGRTGPVACVVPATQAGVVRLRKALMGVGVYPAWIRYPGGPVGGFLRLAWSSAHPDSEVARLIEGLGAGLK